jgi:hypothetical protein
MRGSDCRPEGSTGGGYLGISGAVNRVRPGRHVL